ncbi:hypothetical protein FGO68_gene16862 [Halteria grandinella]|uniref:MORN repeat-containing protein n=1 Tax=Halteria grandinella TaxID=5974 RepID=A0A8J8NUA1_HALGN|nr:hypothetical protein FGO68_gene16862 [Halteria grandinella]
MKHINRVVEWKDIVRAKVPVNGINNGIYYGQTANGKRDGFGIFYCTKYDDTPYLFECEWKQDFPINEARYICVRENRWQEYQGQINWSYLINGKGVWKTESLHEYIGDFRDGKSHGKGKYIYPNGKTYDGEWENDKKHGYGKMTLADGSVQEGIWKENNFLEERKSMVKPAAIPQKYHSFRCK